MQTFSWEVTLERKNERKQLSDGVYFGIESLRGSNLLAPNKNLRWGSHIRVPLAQNRCSGENVDLRTLPRRIILIRGRDCKMSSLSLYSIFLSDKTLNFLPGRWTPGIKSIFPSYLVRSFGHLTEF